jgi:SET domain-containing protein
MLLVNARAGISAIHGVGLIAQEFIPKGTCIWQFQPGFDLVIDENDFLKLSAPAQQQVRHYAFFDEARRVFVLSSDDDRFTNHSDNPNTLEDGGV